MRIAIMGAGGIGGCYGGLLAKAGFDVTLIARGAHLEATTEKKKDSGWSSQKVNSRWMLPPPATHLW